MRSITRRSFIAFAGAGLASLALSGCSSDDSTSASVSSGASQGAPANSTSSDSSTATSTKSPAMPAIVAYFSATGNTKKIAKRIAAAVGADTYEITPAKPYTSADLDYNDSKSRTSKEAADASIRPALSEQPIDFSRYATVYLGYPIWWSDAPRIMSTFVESVDLRNATVVPFVTSSSSPIGSSAKTLQEQANGGTWKDGGRIDTSASDADILDFIERNE